jgi:hypothetical protein
MTINGFPWTITFTEGMPQRTLTHGWYLPFGRVNGQPATVILLVDVAAGCPRISTDFWDGAIMAGAW